MVKEDRSTWKAKYTMRLTQYLDEYPKVFIVGADNVGSRQMQKIRVSLRGHAVLMMGKKYDDAKNHPRTSLSKC